MTTFTHQYAEGNVRTPFNKGKEFISATLSLTAAEVANGNILEFFRLPINAIVTDAYLKVDQLDTDGTATLTIDVGHDGDTDAFVDGSTLAQTGGTVQLTTNLPLLPRDPTDPTQNDNDPYTIEEGTVVSARFATAAATAAAGDVTLAIEFTRI